MKEYENTAEDIKQKILSGEFAPGQRLPSIKKLAQIYNVSTITIRNAILQLTTGGYIETRERSGCFVRNVEDRNDLHIEFNQVFNMIDELLEFEVVCQEVVHGLSLKNEDGTFDRVEEDFVRTSWLFYSYFHAPITYDTAYICCQSEEEKQKILEIRGYEEIWQLLNNAKRTTLIVKLVIPDRNVKKILALQPEEYVFCIDQRYYRLDESLLGVSRTYVLPDSISLHAVTAK